jgi:hypothetical protein
MQLSLLIALTCSFSSFADQDDPFSRPQPPEKLENKPMTGVGRIIPTMMGRGIEDHNMFEPEEKVELKNKFEGENFTYKGKINGVSMYFNNETSKYEFDKGKIVEVPNVKTKLPELNSVNY